MANNVKIGTLYYELNAGGNILDILNKSKKEAIELGKTIDSINKKEVIKTSNESYNNLIKAKRAAALMALETDRLAGAAAKAALEQERLARVNEIASRSADRHALSQQKLATETLRTEAASKKLAASQSSFERAIGLTNKMMFSQKNLLNQLSNAAGIYFSIYEVGRFVKNLAQVSGEFEQQHIALRAILRDADSADRIFAQIKDLSVISPFTFKDLTSYTKQLSAFQVPINELYDTTKRLADVSAGLGVDMSRIILAYGQVRSASVLRGQELRQFTEAGIPLVDELAKKFGELENRVVSASEVFDKISTRQVPFEMVKDVFQEMTDEGGMFYNMQEKLSESLAGKLSNLTDAYQIMLSDIGKANDGILKGGVEALTSLMEHWEDFARILEIVIAAYGSYKAAIILVNTAQKVQISLQTISFFMNLSKALGATASNATVASVAMKNLTATMLANPAMLFATAISAIVTSFVLFNKEARNTEEILSDLNQASDEYLNLIDGQNNRVENLLNTYESLHGKTNLTESEQKKLNYTIKELSTIVPEAIKSLDEYGKVLDIDSKLIKQYTEEQKQYARERLKNSIEDAKKEIEQLKEQQAGLSSIINNGVALYSRPGEFIGYSKLEGEALKKYQNERADIADKITSLNNQLIKSQKLLNDVLSETPNTEPLKEWVKIANEIAQKDNASFEFKVKTDETQLDYIERLAESYKEYEEQLKKLSYVNMSEAETIDALTQKIGILKQVFAALGVDIQNFQKVGSKGKNKDAVTENLKTQLDLIKDAISQYKKLREVMSEENAVNQVKSIPGFEGVDTKYFKDNGLETALIDSLNKIQNRNTDAARKVRETWNKELRNIKADELTKNIRKELSNIQDYVDRYVSQYNLYEQLLGTTGNRNLSFRLAFDADTQGLDILDFMKGQLEKMLDSSGYEGLNFFDVLKMNNEQKNKLPNEIQSLFDSILKKSEEMKNQTKVQVVEAINEYQKYEQEIQAVTFKYDELIAKAKQLGLSQSDIGIIEKQKDRKISDLKFEQFKKSEDWALAFEDLDRLSTATIKRLINSFEELKRSEKTMDIANLKELGEVIEKLREEVLDRNPFKALKDSIEDYKISSGNLKNAQKQYDIIKNGGQVAKGWELDKNTNKMIPVYKSLADAEKEVTQAQDEMKDSSKNVGDAFQALAQEIIPVIGAASEFTSAVSDAFAAFGNEDQADKWGMASEAIGMFGQTISDVASKIMTGDFIGAALSVAALPAKLAAAFAEFHDKKLDRQIKESELQVKKLENAYKNLEWQIERTYGEDKFKKTGESLANIRQQQIEISRQLELERQKKNQDDEAIADYQQQLAELDRQFQETLEGIRNEVFDSVSSMASQLSSAIVEAFRNGEDAAKAWGDTVDDIVLQVVANLMATKYIEPVVDEWIKGLEDSVDLSGAKKTLLEEELRRNKVDREAILAELDKRYDKYKGGLSKEDYLKYYMPDEYREYLKILREKEEKEKELDRLKNMTLEEQLDIFGESGEELKDKIENMDILQDIESFVKGYLGDKSTTAEGITKSAQSLTEETGNLLASYTNAIRADVSVIRRIAEEGEIRRANMIKVYMEALTQYPNVFNQIALMQADIKRIEANTFRSANNSDVILQGVNEMNTRFRQATTPGSGIKLNI